MRIDILTIFPEMFPPVLGTSIPRIAAEKGIVEYYVRDMRDFSSDRRRTIDDRPYGGGPGMVMMCEPVFKAVESVESECSTPSRRILLCPQGRKLDQKLAEDLAESERIMLVCGHYEGFDERIRLGLDAEEISIGDYVVSGGEIAALVIVDAVVRLIPGALGHEESVKEESFADGKLEYPQYTRPPVFRDMAVPEILLSGDHGRIAEWRKNEALKRTRERRPDLLKGTGKEEEK